ncbi:hypothetical protein BT67DRAFT_439878 [Trichocladium antarcticum]|uniref:Uncharacterized protein n=1 Tax=Trichocladium antarcticum TaxID=1450529 RepID=A0AAN6UQ83_9PEZI|nr:hypothetical protein BT67DRAFT_439878 [Trichocladium antarcticum]
MSVPTFWYQWIDSQRTRFLMPNTGQLRTGCPTIPPLLQARDEMLPLGVQRATPIQTQRPSPTHTYHHPGPLIPMCTAAWQIPTSGLGLTMALKPGAGLIPNPPGTTCLGPGAEFDFGPSYRQHTR